MNKLPDYHTYLTTPFFASDKLVKIPTRLCICIGENELNELSKEYGENMNIVFNINYIIYNIKETRITTVGQIKRMIKNGLAKIRYGKAVNRNMISLDKRNCKLVD